MAPALAPVAPLNSEPAEKQPLEKVVSHLLEECRMVLPGIQAMFGFQLIAVFNTTFSAKLTHDEQCAHFASVAFMVLAIAALLAPAAYHRIVETESISEAFVKFTSLLLGTGMFFLMLGIIVDFYLIARIILQTPMSAVISTAMAALILLSLWFIFPLIKRMSRLSAV